MSRINEESFRKKYYEINRADRTDGDVGSGFGADDTGFGSDKAGLEAVLNAERAGFDEKENLPEFKNFLGERADGKNVDNGHIAVLSTATLRRWIVAGKYRSDELSKKKLVESGLVDPLADGFMVYDDDVLPYSLFHGDDVGCTYVLHMGGRNITLQIIDPETFFFALPFADASNRNDSDFGGDGIGEGYPDEFDDTNDSDVFDDSDIDDEDADDFDYGYGADDERTVTEDRDAEEKDRVAEGKIKEKNYPALSKPTMVIVVDAVKCGSLISVLRNTCDGKPSNDWFDFLFPGGRSDEAGLKSKFFISLIDGRALKVVASSATPYAYCDKQSTLVSRLSLLWMNGFADPDKKWIKVVRENERELFGRNDSQTLVLITDDEQNFTPDDAEWFENLKDDVKTFVIGVGSGGKRAALALEPDESRSFVNAPSKEDLKKAFESVVRMTGEY